MALASEVVKKSYSGDDSTTVFPTTFIFYEDSGIKVVLRVDATGVETTQTLTTHYTLSGGNGATGDVTMVTPPATGETLLIKSDIPDTQVTELPIGGKFPSAAVEKQLDIITRLIQQKQEDLNRAIKLSETSSLVGSVSLPEPVALSVLSWNAAADNLANITLADISVSIDTVFTSLASDDFLKYDGSNWINRTSAETLTDIGAQADLAVPSQAEAEAGTATTERVWTAERVKQAIESLSLGRGFIDGMVLSNDTDTAHDISISAGECRDSTNATNLKADSAFVKRIDATWAVGTTNGGLDTGAVANSTWYYVHAILLDSDGVTVDYLFSTSATSPTMPSGYTKFRAVGAVLTDGSANIIQFIQDGDLFEFLAPIHDVDQTNGITTTAGSHALSVPSLAKGVTAIMNLRMNDNSNAASMWVYPTDITDAPPSDIASPGATLKTDRDGTNGNETFLGGYHCRAVSGNVRIVGDATLDQVDIFTTGFIYKRGKE